MMWTTPPLFDRRQVDRGQMDRYITICGYRFFHNERLMQNLTSTRRRVSRLTAIRPCTRRLAFVFSDPTSVRSLNSNSPDPKLHF